jgi:hypothetical protein
MDDPLSSLGLTAVTLCQSRPSFIKVLIKRPFKNTLTYQHISYASYRRLERLARSGSAELIQVPNTRQEDYFLFYWQKRYLIQPGYPPLPGLNCTPSSDLYTS